MKSKKNQIGTFTAIIFLLLVTSYLSYQIGKDAAKRDARIKMIKK